MKKRGLASLFIVSIIAIAAVVGVIFAFQNSKRQTDVYGSITVAVDKDDVKLEVELEKDDAADKKFRIVETPLSSTYVTVTVGGLPASADHSVDWNESSLSSGVVKVERVTPLAESGKTGINTFKLTGQNGGAPVSLVFVTASGSQTATVKVTVNMLAKDMKLGPGSHFGVRQGSAAVNLMSADMLSKFVFYAHPEDVERAYTPNKFPVKYQLKQNYTGVTLENGFLTVTDAATCVDQYIDLQVKLPDMDDWLDVPFYVFPAADKIISTTNAYKAATTSTYENVWDLIANRTEQSSATFEFELNYAQPTTSDYGFKVVSTDTTIVRVDPKSPHERILSTFQNLGEVAVQIVGYPIITDEATGREIYFSDDADANVQIFDTIYLRVRNEFYRESETSYFGENSFNLTSDKEKLNVFYYDGNIGDYYDVFSLNTGNGKTVNMDAEVEFELIVEDSNGTYSGTYRWDGTGNNQGWDIYSILKIAYWSNAADDWVTLGNQTDKFYANYLNRFSIAFMPSGNALNFLNDNITSLILRAKSVNELSVTGHATYDMVLEPTCAIDKFEIPNLTRFDDGTSGIALVYNTKTKLFNSASIDVYGMIAKGNNFEYSARWDTSKVTYNRDQLPFAITCNPRVEFTNEAGIPGYYHLTYHITADDIDEIAYYKDYPMVIKYPNGKTYTINIRVYPTVESLSMSVVSNSKGKVYQTITNNYNSYEYVRTVYVRKGFDYQFAVDTPSVNVGAYAAFDQVVDANNQVISTDTKNFNATDLAEGLYTCTVSLHAYSEEVYQAHQRQATVYMIVVDPVGNVVPTLNLDLEGVGDEKEITLDLTTLDGKVITDNHYLQIDLAQNNENVAIERGNVFNQFKVTAKYLTKETFNIGFKISKRYVFDDDDLDGDGFTDEDPFEFKYLGGALVNTTIKINHEKPNTVTLVDETIKERKALGLVSSAGAVDDTEIAVKTVGGARNQKIGIAFAEWKNGKFVLAPFAPLAENANLQIGGVATACLTSATTHSVIVRPVQNVTSMGEYALAIYACDSLHYVETDGNGNELVLPTNYELINLFVGSAADINASFEELKNNVRDANSGKRNDLGGYNWILPAQNTSNVAALFYTDIKGSSGSQIKANVYSFNDLYTVLGWDRLKVNSQTPKILLKKYVKVGDAGATQVGQSVELRPDVDGKLDAFKVDLAVKYAPDDPAEEMYSHDDVVVYFETDTYPVMTFYVVKYINQFDVMIVSQNSNGLVARRNLSPDEYTDAYNSTEMQRGNGFHFSSNLDLNAGWRLNQTNFDAAEEGRTSYISYEGGVYSFFPYIKFDTYTFNLDALTAKVKVGVKGGVNYLNIVQDAISLDGVTTATYDLTLRVDQANWSPDLLTYDFLYDGVYYSLFADGTTVSYVNLEGGKAKLEFKLKCLNANSPVTNFYYTYYLRIEVAVVIINPDVDPFYDVSGARLIVRENLAKLSFAKMEDAEEDSAAFNLTKQGIYNVTMAHFAETNAVKNNKSALTLTTGQTDAGVIYLDNDSVGGLLVVHPTPYYINVFNVALSMTSDGSHTERVQIGTDLTGKPIYDTVTYSIGFTQMIYNETEKNFQPYLLGNGSPKMVSTWSAAEGYKWTGKYYFKTNIVTDSQYAYRLPNGTRFKIQISIQGESNAKPIIETMTLDAKYRDSFVVNPNGTVEDHPVRTMLQTRYQAVGTTAVYDVALPANCVPNYANFTLNGMGTSTATIQSTYADVTIDSVAQTLSVYLKADAKLIGEVIEIRIPYNRPNDYANPYLSVVVVPVYFEFDGLEVIDHYETRLQLDSQEALAQLQYRALFKTGNVNLPTSTLNEQKDAFNQSLLTTKLISFNQETPGEITVQVPYTYVNGVPVLTKNADNRYVHTFYYDVISTKPLIKRTEYLAVGTSATYTFNNWNPLYFNNLHLQDGSSNASGINEFWDRTIESKANYTVAITVSLENRSATVSDHDAYQYLINAKKIVVNVYSTANMSAPQLELTIIPVYFTFDGFKLQNNPVRPLVALTSATTVTVEAGNISAVNDSEVTNAINTFNASLLNAQNNLSTSTELSFKRVPNDDGILNFNFDPFTRALARADVANPISATSYLLVTAGITYVNGVPTLNRTGNQVSTYIPVRTFGANSNENGTTTPGLELAPNGRTRTIAQAIGTKVRYNVSLPGVAYDSLLDKYEIRTDGNYVWRKNFGWNVSFNVKESIITVTLDANTSLFDKTLVIMAYNQAGELMYVLNIIPAYFTVEQIILAEHIDENPVMIRTGNSNWLQDLRLDFTTTHGNVTGFSYAANIDSFRDSLNNSSLVSRIDDANYITLMAGIDYEGGIPSLANQINSATIIENVYRYELVDGVPENTKVHALGTAVTYHVNRSNADLRIYNTDNETWVPYSDSMSNLWTLETVGTNKVKVTLYEAESLIGNRIRIGVFVNSNVEPDYILNIVPVYFSVEDLRVAGQTSEDHDIFLYYGENPASPKDVVFDAVYGEHSANSSFNISQRKATFIEELQTTKANLIGRFYDNSLMSGDLHITIYLDYSSGTPTLVANADENPNFVVRLDDDFWYAIYGRNHAGNFPPMPNGPRTRTEVQAIGTTANYTIDLNQTLDMDVDALIYDAETLAERGWKVSFADNVLTVELLPDNLLENLLPEQLNNLVDRLLADDLVFNFYSGSNKVFVLTVQPVLFKVVGIETVYPEQPINLVGINVDDIIYRAKVEYNNDVKYNNTSVIEYLERFNTQLNAAKNGLLEIEDDGRYLKLDVAVDYGMAGSSYRLAPKLLNATNYPLNVVESYVEYSKLTSSTVATNYQAIGTTEYYYLGAGFKDAVVSMSNVSIDGVVGSISDYVSIERNTNYGSNTYVLKVDLKPNANLIGRSVTITINGDTTLTMNIQPVWFVVDGFEVINHPERHMWLINSKTTQEDVGDLLFRVRAKQSMNVSLLADIQTKIDAFNAHLASYDNENKKWVAQDWATNLETYTIGGRYLVVRAAINYANGDASIVAIDGAKPTTLVRDVFEYVRYSDQIEGSTAYPNVPYSRVEDIALGYGATYTLDIPNFNGLNDSLIAVYENSNVAFTGDDSKLQPYTENLLSVHLSGNQLQVQLSANPELVNHEFKVFVYYDVAHVNDVPDSTDREHVAFVLTIHPVYFKVTGFKITGYNTTPIYVTDIDEFNQNLVSGSNQFVPVYQYSNDLLDVVTDMMDDFTNEFISSPYVIKTRNYDGAGVFYYQVTTSIGYQPFEGTAYLTNNPAYSMWQNFKVVVANELMSKDRIVYQAIGTEKAYYIDHSVLTTDLDDMFNGAAAGVNNVAINGADYIVNWSKNNPYRITVTLQATASIDTQVEIEVSDKFTLKINPVYYEVLGFEPVGHPERPVRVIAPETVNGLQYRMMTTSISTDLQEHVSELNQSLNNGVAPKTINIINNQYIVIDAAVNYINGYPQFVVINKDKNNVVESIFAYRTWKSNNEAGNDSENNGEDDDGTVPSFPENRDDIPVVGNTKEVQLLGKTKRYTLANIKGIAHYELAWAENADNLLSPFDNSVNGTEANYENLSMLMDLKNNTLRIQLSTDTTLLTRKVRVYIPYVATVNGKRVWYRHEIEITPVLFELVGWEIAGLDDINLVKIDGFDNRFLLTKVSQPVTPFKYVARINACEVNDVALQNAIAEAKTRIESTAFDYMIIGNPANYISFNGHYINRICAADEKSETLIDLSSYVIYENGVPNLVSIDDELIHSGNNNITQTHNQILLYTGYDKNELDLEVATKGSRELLQALGTFSVYTLTIPNAAQIFENQIKIIDRNTGNSINTFGENLVQFTVQDVDTDYISYSLNLAAMSTLFNHVIEICIPYAEDANAIEPTYVHKDYIIPVLFRLDGWEIAGVDENSALYKTQNPDTWALLPESGIETPFKYVARITACETTDDVLQALINDTKEILENSAADYMLIDNPFNYVTFAGSNLVRNCEPYFKSVNIIGLSTYVSYENGIPTLANSGATSVYNEIYLTTGYDKPEFPVEPWPHEIGPVPVDQQEVEVDLVHNNGHVYQALGTTAAYVFEIADTAKIFTEQIEILNNATGEPVSVYGENLVTLIFKNANPDLIDCEISLAGKTMLFNKMLQISIPYAEDVNAATPTNIYNIYVTPVLFELKGWTIAAGEGEESALIQDSNVSNSLILTKESNARTLFKYVAQINEYETADVALQNLIVNTKINLENTAVLNMFIYNPNDYIDIDGNYLVRNYPVDFKSTTRLGLTTYFTYVDGIPTLVRNSANANETYSDVLITTGYNLEDWPPIPWPLIEPTELIVLGNSSDNQLLGTSMVYSVEIPGTKKIFDNQIVVVRKDTNRPVIIDGENVVTFRSNGVVGNYISFEVSLAPVTGLLGQEIEICIPCADSVNASRPTHVYKCLINPILFKLCGWRIAGLNDHLICDEQFDNRFLLTKEGQNMTPFKYVAQIIAANIDNETFKNAIADAKLSLENDAFTYMLINNPSTDIINFNGHNIERICAADYICEVKIGLTTYIVYENGRPNLVHSGSQNAIEVTDKIRIYTGYSSTDWPLTPDPRELEQKGIRYDVQAVGVSTTYNLEIPNAVQIFANKIKIVKQGTNEPISIEGAQADLITLDVIDVHGSNLNFTLNLAPVVDLRDYVIEILIPYTDDVNAVTPNYVYQYFIVPTLFTVDGFYLAGHEDNNLHLIDDTVLNLRVSATYSQDVFVRDLVNVALNEFEMAVNNAIYNESFVFRVVNVEGGINAELLSNNKQILIHKIGKATAINNLEGRVIVGYRNAVPVLGSVDPLLDHVISTRIVINTEQGDIPSIPDVKDIDEDQIIVSKYVQAVGTSCDYLLTVDDMNVTFYYDNIKIITGENNEEATKSGENEYELFNCTLINAGIRNLTIGFTLKNTVENPHDYIKINVPFTNYIDGKEVWFIYSLQIKPVLYEVVGWKLKVGDSVTDTVTINDSAVKLYFSPEVKRGSANLNNITAEDNSYIENAIERLETKINTYDSNDSDGYPYLILNNTAQEGHQVNYYIERDESSNISYLRRSINELSTTIMQVSGYINYVSNLDDGAVDGSQIIKSSASAGGQHLTSEITINTTELGGSQGGSSAGGSIENPEDNPTVFIYQNETSSTAERLLSLVSGYNYVLMSDIYLYKIKGLEGGRWKPVDFPSNTTLDGNNFRIFFNPDTGFDLSGNPDNIGLFNAIPAGAVVKNLQIVIGTGEITADTSVTTVATLNIDLAGYNDATASIGLLAGASEGIVSNCAILSQWQFYARELKTVENPVTGQKFTTTLPFNKDGYLFDDEYFYHLGLNNEGKVIVDKYYHINPEGEQSKAYRVIEFNANALAYGAEFIDADRTIVANYNDYSPMIIHTKSIESTSPAKLFVNVNNKTVNVTLGGLIGSNAYMITNSRVLIDVELYGPERSTNAGAIDDPNIASSIVGGLVGHNSGTIASSFFRDASVVNNANANTLDSGVCMLGGFVGQNTGIIQQCYAMGRSTERKNNLNFISTAGAVKTIRNSLGGFVHNNSGTITDCFVNLVVWKTGPEGAAGGFVFENTTEGKIKNCIENNDIILQSSGTLDYYAPFVYKNGNTAVGIVNTKNLSNLIYAGNAESISLSADWNGTLKHLTNNAENYKDAYANIKNYGGFSMGSNDEDWEISNKNTIWNMTDVGPMLRVANDIAVSYRKDTGIDPAYLYNPGTSKNPYLIWTEAQFNQHVYGDTAVATAADRSTENEPLTNIENNLQRNHIRLVDNVKLNGITDTYKIVYTGIFEGNGLKMSGISLDTVANELATMGLFGKTEYATIRNINFEIGKINSTARYVGGIAGIAINTNFVDVSVVSSDTIQGANIVGGFVGLNVVKDSAVENYNLYSSVSVTANFHSKQTDVGAKQFSSGMEYYQQTLYAKVEALNISYEQGYCTAGGVFGFITSNPNVYRVVNENGNPEYYARKFEQEIVQKDAAGEIYGTQTLSSYNTEASWFLRANDDGHTPIEDIKAIENHGHIYYGDFGNLKIRLHNVTGAIKNISGNVAGGLIGIMDETIELNKPLVTSLSRLTGKYYLGGMVGINLGKISGEIIDGNNQPYNAMTLTGWSVLSSAGTSYVFQDNPATNTENTRFWGMVVGAVAGYNDGFSNNPNSGVIENMNVSVNVLGTSSSVYQYIIGGVVGVNGHHGNVVNSNNTHIDIKTDSIQVKLDQAKRIGYYYGHIVGYDLNNTSFNDDSKVILKTIRMDFPASYGTNSYVSESDFATPDYKVDGVLANAFRIEANTTLKIQTMTMDEYYEYLKKSIVNKDLQTRVEMLEAWVRSLPKGENTTKAVSGEKTVWAQTYNQEAKTKLIEWIKANKIFEEWDYAHRALSNYTELILSNYDNYLQYKGVSDYSYEEESDTDFENRIENYHEVRYKNALNFFTYQNQVTATGIAGEQNAEFTWNQYEKYLIFTQNARTTVDKNALSYAFKGKYGDEFVDMLCPNNLLAEYVNEPILINNHDDSGFKKLEKYFEVDKRFTNKDPLQIYLNYVVLSKRETNPFQIGNRWKLELAQYYYYMSQLYGKEYETYSYKIPENFTAIKENNVPAYYVLYIYTNNSLHDAADKMLTIPEFIYLMSRENKTVMEGETAWIKTGHLGGGGARLSAIGAIELGWVANVDDWNYEIQNSVKVQNDEVISCQINEITHEWDAWTKYLTAKEKLGLDILKYTQINNLGGSLYGLIQRNTDENDELVSNQDAADNYIFALQCEQYDWTDAQIEFIKNHYVTDGMDDMLYALTATTYGDVLSSINGNSSVRAVYKTDAQTIDESSDLWYTDNNSNGSHNEGEPRGVLYLSGTNTTVYTNGDTKDYFIYSPNGERTINLRANGNVGAAMYLDMDNNKMFGSVVYGSGSAATHTSGGDILLIYKLENPKLDDATNQNFPDFYTQDEHGETYYKIARQIVAGNEITDAANEASGNHADYLEEALWWRNQGFTAEQFDQIKNHAMYHEHYINGGYVDSANNYTTRKSGCTLADDWFYATTDCQSGFKTENFTSSEYVEIVLGAQYDTATVWDGTYTANGFDLEPFKHTYENTWFSNYADYRLFVLLNHAKATNKTEICVEDVTKGPNGESLLPATSIFRYPFEKLKDSNDFLLCVVPQTELADAMEFSGKNPDHAAFLELFRAGSNAAKYIDWAGADKLKYQITTKDGQKSRCFRLNHYIYWIKNQVDTMKKFDGDDLKPEDFRWALTTSNRNKIRYKDVTPEKCTTDLIEYRLNWYNDITTINNGKPFMTFRDYYEWINIYAYSDDYKTARGEMETVDSETGETQTETAGDGWLTIEAFAVWKRMEKYENNVEYLAKFSGTAGENPITEPELKRQISTTIFPKIYSSGEKAKNENTGEEYGNYVLPDPDGNGPDTIAKTWYGWDNPGFDTNYRDMDPEHQRPVEDRFEYNERYHIYSVTDRNRTLNENADWKRYDENKLVLDEVELTKIGDKITAGNAYAQLYIPYAYFETACTLIKSVYSATNNYAGYHNYMKYWARNGSWNQICTYQDPEYKGSDKGFDIVQHDYNSIDFWNNYDGTKSPLDGAAATGPVYWVA